MSPEHQGRTEEPDADARVEQTDPEAGKRAGPQEPSASGHQDDQQPGGGGEKAADAPAVSALDDSGGNSLGRAVEDQMGFEDSEGHGEKQGKQFPEYSIVEHPPCSDQSENGADYRPHGGRQPKLCPDACSGLESMYGTGRMLLHVRIIAESKAVVSYLGHRGHGRVKDSMITQVFA